MGSDGSFNGVDFFIGIGGRAQNPAKAGCIGKQIVSHSQLGPFPFHNHNVPPLPQPPQVLKPPGTGLPVVVVDIGSGNAGIAVNPLPVCQQQNPAVKLSPNGAPVHFGIQVALPAVHHSPGNPDEQIFVPGLKHPGQLLRQFRGIGLEGRQVHPEHPPNLPIPEPAQGFPLRNQHVHRFLVIIKAKLRCFPVPVPDAGRSKSGQLPGQQIQINHPVWKMFFQPRFPIFLHLPIPSKGAVSSQDWMICCPSSKDWAIRNRWGLRYSVLSSSSFCFRSWVK